MKTVLITGANRGLGREAARQLGERGWRVIIGSRDAANGEAVAQELSMQGHDAVAIGLDVADPDSVAAALNELRAQSTSLAALVNNAGIALDGFDADVVRRTLAVNAHGAAAVTDALRPLLADDARVVMVSSGMGELSCVGPQLRPRFESPKLRREELVALLAEFVRDVEAGVHTERGWPSSSYRVSKVALNALTRLLDRDGLLVNAVCPGWVRTEMGGRGATRSVEEGAKGIVWAATLPADGPSGGFFRDGQPIAW